MGFPSPAAYEDLHCVLADAGFYPVERNIIRSKCYVRYQA